MVATTGKHQWTILQIAALSDLQLASLNCDEMVNVIQASGVPVRGVRRIEYDALAALVYQARHFCLQQPDIPQASAQFNN